MCVCVLERGWCMYATGTNLQMTFNNTEIRLLHTQARAFIHTLALCRGDSDDDDDNDVPIYSEPIFG